MCKYKALLLLDKVSFLPEAHISGQTTRLCTTGLYEKGNENYFLHVDMQQEDAKRAGLLTHKDPCLLT